MLPTVFSLSEPLRVRGKTYSSLTFNRMAGPTELQMFTRFTNPKRRACAVMGQLAGVPLAVIDSLSDADFVRLERETRHLFAVA